MSEASKKKTAVKKPVRKSDQYNDPTHNYLHYWDDRDYEHESEVIAIERLLKGRHFANAVDVGGGYGRLCVVLDRYADKVTLAEPSQQQLDIAEEYLADYPSIDRKLVQAADMPFKDKSVDLLTMVRVMHHLPDPSPEFREIHRVLADDGWFILEIANYAHGRNRLKHILKGKRLPEHPVDIRSKENRRDDEIAFVNHNPKTVAQQLAHAGFKVTSVLSVSNLRSPGIKKILPVGTMVGLEKRLQPLLAKSYFGPSVFFLVKKAS